MNFDENFQSAQPLNSTTKPGKKSEGALLFSSSHVRSAELGKQMEAIGAKVRVVSDMTIAKNIIEKENSVWW